MNCPHCDDPKEGEFPGIGVRCKSCRKYFYAGRNGVGYESAPWAPWLYSLVLPLAVGGAVWGIIRFLWIGDFVQVAKILVGLGVGVLFGEIMRRYSTLPEI